MKSTLFDDNDLDEAEEKFNSQERENEGSVKTLTNLLRATLLQPPRIP
jgi:hypothetical protein